MQVYVVLYSNEGNFMMGHKPLKGYFFHTSSGDGEIHKYGQDLHGGGKYALPGGGLEGGDIVVGAKKEFMEECGSKIAFSDTKKITIEKQAYDILKTDSWPSSDQKYSAVFFKVSNDHLSQILDIILTTNLGSAKEAVDKIKKGAITNYKQIFKEHPYSPPDNELDSVEAWNAKNDWVKVERLQLDKDTNWFYEILSYWKDNIL